MIYVNQHQHNFHVAFSGVGTFNHARFTGYDQFIGKINRLRYLRNRLGCTETFLMTSINKFSTDFGYANNILYEIKE